MNEETTTDRSFPPLIVDAHKKDMREERYVSDRTFLLAQLARIQMGLEEAAVAEIAA